MSDGHDVFVSFAWADIARVRPIVDSLRGEGLRVWFAESDIDDFESITHRIQHSLAQCKALLAFYSSTYPTRRACQRELTAAFIAAQNEGDPRSRVLVINPEPGVEHIHPIELRDAKFLRPPASVPAGLKELACAVGSQVATLGRTFGEIYSLKMPQWFGMRGVGSTRFVGRLEELWRLHSLLHASDVALITGTAAGAADIAQVTGLGGIGKSQLAEEYALRFGAAFPGGIFWQRAYGNDDAKVGMGATEREVERLNQVRAFAAGLGIGLQGRAPEEIEAALARAIEERGLPCLWVVDDVPSGLDGERLRRWFAPHPVAKTLLTTRSREYGALAQTLDLGVLSEEAAYQLLTWRRKPLGEAEEVAAHGIVRDLGWHSLAVDVAGAALKQSEGVQSFVEYREEFVRADKDVLELSAQLADALPNGHEKNIAKTLLRSIERLAQPGRDFLTLVSTLTSAPIHPRLLEAVFREIDGLKHDAARQRAMQALHEADALSLSERTGEGGEFRRVHTLVSRAVHFWEAPHGLGGWRQRYKYRRRLNRIRLAAVKVLTEDISETAQSSISQVQSDSEAALARELASRVNELPEPELLSAVSHYDYARGNYKASAGLRARRLEICRRRWGWEHHETVDCMVDLAGALLFQGEPSQARPILEQALAISVRGYGFTHPRSLSIRNNLAVTIRQLGGINEAAQLHAEVLEARLKVSGAEDRDTLVAASNLAEALLVQGKLAEARSLQEKTLETSRRVLGENDLGTLLQENNLGVILSAQGDFSGARKLLEKALSSRKRILGPRHGDTSASAFNLLTVLQRSEDHEGAQKVLEEYLDWLLKGEDYPLDIYQRRIRRWLIDRSSSECSAASLNQLPSAPPVPNEKHENNQVDLSASDFHSPWPQVRDRPSVGDAARLGFGWNGHKQALKLLALIYRKPSAFLSELNRLSPARQVVAGLLLMVHGFPYLVFTSALGGHLATTFSKFVAQLCNLSAPTQPPLSRYVLMRILIALGLGVLSGTILGALRRSRTIGVVAFLVVTPSVVFAGCAFGPSPDAEINIPLMSLLCFTLGLDWTIAIGLGNVFESVRRGEVRRTVEVMVSYLFIAGLIYGITIKVGGGGRPPLSHRLEAGGIWAVLWTSAFLVGAFRLYYIPLHLVLLWPKARASWYGLHPVAWDDLCLMRFPYLDQFLMAFARKDPAGAEDEIQRLICAYPSQGIAALRAKLKILQSKEPSTLP